MRKYAIGIVLALALAVVIAPSRRISAQSGQDAGLPTLNVINEVTLSPCYSCRSQQDSDEGYQNTALFLSAYSQIQNEPDLLFNGSPGGADYFETSTAGDDMAVIADLGTNVDLTTLSAQRAFAMEAASSSSGFSKFAEYAQVKALHTYAVVINKADVRGLLVFTVTSHIPNQEVDIEYAVKEYQLTVVQAASPGFSWTTPNQ